MATGFTRETATSILSSWINSNTLVCLSTTTPDMNGDNFTEPSAANGYARHTFGPTLLDVPGQVANAQVIFLFEATGDCGSITHVGLARNYESKPFLVAQLSSPLSVAKGYVPLIRAKQFVIGLDKDTLEAYP